MTPKIKFCTLWILGILCNTIPRFWDFGTMDIVGEQYTKFGAYIYYSGQAASYLFLVFAVLFKGKSLIERQLFGIGIWMMLSNVFDELGVPIGTDPVHLGYNELFFAIAIIVWVFIIQKQYVVTA